MRIRVEQSIEGLTPTQLRERLAALTDAYVEMSRAFHDAHPLAYAVHVMHTPLIVERETGRQDAA
jgi:predicted membrane chloride channel (bestrophin family)